MAVRHDVSLNGPVDANEIHIHARNDVVSGIPEAVVIGTDFSAPCRALVATAADTLTIKRRDGTNVANFYVAVGENPVDCIQVVSQAGSANLVALI